MSEETIFQAALEREDATERAAYLDAACAGNPGLRERVEALLRSHADPDSFLDVPALARQATGADEPSSPTRPPADGENGPTGDWLAANSRPMEAEAATADEAI